MRWRGTDVCALSGVVGVGVGLVWVGQVNDTKAAVGDRGGDAEMRCGFDHVVTAPSRLPLAHILHTKTHTSSLAFPCPQ